MAYGTKKFLMVFEKYIPELKNYDSILFLHQPMTSGQPLKIVQRHMANPVCIVVKSMVTIWQNFVAFSDYMYFTLNMLNSRKKNMYKVILCNEH